MMTYLSKELLREQGKTKAIETTYDTPFALIIRVKFGRSTIKRRHERKTRARQC